MNRSRAFRFAAAFVLTAILAACAGAPGTVPAPTGPASGDSRAESPDAESGKPSMPSSAPSPAMAMESSSADKLGPSGFSPSGAGAADAAPPPPAMSSAPSVGRTATGQSGLKAGYSDDNEQFNYFLKFLGEFARVRHYELAVRERIVVKVRDTAGMAVLNAQVEARSGGKVLARGKTYADGSFSLYPLELGAPEARSYELAISSAAGQASLTVDRAGPRSVTATLDGKRAVPAPLPVDLVFILDTTGSMGEEIERLRATIEIISANIASLKPKPALRFGMVLYKDRGDDYDTQIVPLTPSLPAFQEVLDEVYADGGGDGPEDLQTALGDAVNELDWNPDGLRLGFVITDAPPHLDYDQEYDYARAARDAKDAAIKLYGIGTGGLPVDGEYVLRQVAQYTQGKYIFLTYGEKTEAEGGAEGSVSHHTGENFATDKLEAVVIRFVKEEIARQSERPLDYDEAYYSAKRTADESSEDTLGKLFSQALQNLADYSSYRLGSDTRCALMPIVPVASPSSPEGAAADGGPSARAEASLSAQAEASLSAQAEYFGSQLALAAAKAKIFTLVERKDLQAVLGELELQLSGLADEEGAAKVGKLLGAEVLVSGTVFRAAENYELFLKLVRVETAEVLAATKAKIDPALGL